MPRPGAILRPRLAGGMKGLRPGSLCAFFMPFVLSVALSAATAVTARADSYTDREAAVRAAFLYNFAKFTRWPSAQFEGPQAPVVFCIYENSLRLDALQAIGSRTIDGRPVVVRPTRRGDPLTPCHLLYVSTNAGNGHVRNLPLESRRSKVLFVSDDPDLADIGGHISLFPIDRKLRFKINLEATRESGIALSSKLLQLAIIVP